MRHNFKGWQAVVDHLRNRADHWSKVSNPFLNESQCASVEAIAERIPHTKGLIIADEVGMGKTRIAVAYAQSVLDAGGRVAVLIPSGLGYQWRDEFIKGGFDDVPQVIRSLKGFLNAFKSKKDALYSKRVVVISHTFANWRLGDTASPFRWAILPQMLAFWHIRNSNRSPNGYREWDEEEERDEQVRTTAKWTVESLKKKSVAWERLKTIDVKTGTWKNSLDSTNYALVNRSNSDGNLRNEMEGAFGLGFGAFDLIIIDEAHKARGETTGLSRLLDSILLKNPDCKYLGMTATPVELDIEQWDQSLRRVGVEDEQCKKILDVAKKYKKRIEEVRVHWKNENTREEYTSIAKQFKEVLSPYVLRRDKREDTAVIAFSKRADLGSSYRAEKRCAVHSNELKASWRSSICAAEALSFVTRRADDPVAKRLRLTFANGHGIATLLSSKADRDEPTEEVDPANLPESQEKRLRRAKWWMNVLEKSLSNEEQNLTTHPAVLKAVEVIEEYCSCGEKVLVFGKFSKPLYALTNLLNARAMVSELNNSEKKPRWPASTVVGYRPSDVDPEQWEWDMWRFIESACSDPDLRFEFNREAIETQLKEQYEDLERDRRYIRENGFKLIKEGIPDDNQPENEELRLLLKAAEESYKRKSTKDQSRTLLTAMASMLEGSDSTQSRPDATDCFEVFRKLMNALRDRDTEGKIYEDDHMDAVEASDLWEELEKRLEDEYGARGSTFARLMVGATDQSTRRLLQLAFNRPNSFPKVLVSQSIVGREGLNLHEACRVVVLLHPEWNPGAVEQQIGRVDRVGSHWSKLLEQAKEGTDLPQIEYCPIVFEGTYDEHNWSVLVERWDNLRAQLHGVVVPHRQRLGLEDDEQKIVRELDAVAPSFSPSRQDIS